SGRETAGDFFPEERGDLVAHDAVEDAPRLLGVDTVLVDGVGLSERLLDVTLGDGREDDALGVAALDAQFLREVPRDGLTLAIEVGGEPDIFAAGEGFLRR